MLHAIIMAGGSGTRFWPKSRRDRPKQLLRLTGECDDAPADGRADRAPGAPGADLDRDRSRPGRGDACSASRPAGRATSIAEPAPRDTAPCVGLAAGIVAARRIPAATMIVMPADHVIEPAEAFLATVRAAVSVIDDDPAYSDHLRHQADPPRDRLRLHRARTAPGNTRRHPGPPGRSVSREARPGDGRAVPGRRQLRLELGDLRLASPHDPG